MAPGRPPECIAPLTLQSFHLPHSPPSSSQPPCHAEIDIFNLPREVPSFGDDVATGSGAPLLSWVTSAPAGMTPQHLASSPSPTVSSYIPEESLPSADWSSPRAVPSQIPHCTATPDLPASAPPQPMLPALSLQSRQTPNWDAPAPFVF